MEILAQKLLHLPKNNYSIIKSSIKNQNLVFWSKLDFIMATVRRVRGAEMAARQSSHQNAEEDDSKKSPLDGLFPLVTGELAGPLIEKTEISSRECMATVYVIGAKLQNLFFHSISNRDHSLLVC